MEFVGANIRLFHVN